MNVVFALLCYAIFIALIVLARVVGARLTDDRPAAREYVDAFFGRSRRGYANSTASEYWAAFTGQAYRPRSNGMVLSTTAAQIQEDRTERLASGSNENVAGNGLVHVSAGPVAQENEEADNSSTAHSRDEVLDVLEEEDISLVVKRLKDEEELPPGVGSNDPNTRALIAAGIRLIRREYTLDVSGRAEIRLGFLSWLSPQAVVEEARLLTRSEISSEDIRVRWDGYNNYLADLISYSLWSHRWHQDKERADKAVYRISQAVDSGSDIVKAVHETAYDDVMALVDTSSYRFQMMAAAAAEADPVIKSAIQDMYKNILENWARVYETVLTKLSLKLRPGLSVQHVADALAATAEGVAMRVLADPEASVIDRQNEVSVLGSVALGLMASWVDHADDHMTLEELVRGRG